jgi:hypothetical protein
MHKGPFQVSPEIAAFHQLFLEPVIDITFYQWQFLPDSICSTFSKGDEFSMNS